MDESVTLEHRDLEHEVRADWLTVAIGEEKFTWQAWTQVFWRRMDALEIPEHAALRYGELMERAAAALGKPWATPTRAGESPELFAWRDDGKAFAIASTGVRLHNDGTIDATGLWTIYARPMPALDGLLHEATMTIGGLLKLAPRLAAQIIGQSERAA